MWSPVHYAWLISVLHSLGVNSLPVEPTWRVFPTGSTINWAVQCEKGCVIALGTDWGAALISATDGHAVISRFGFYGPVRLAGDGWGRIYCFDRYNAYAISTAESVLNGPFDSHALMWNHRFDSSLEQKHDGDPESYVSIIDAGVTYEGLVVLRSNGTLSLLAAESGEPIWEEQFPRLARPRLFVRGEKIAVVGLEDGVQTAHLIEKEVGAGIHVAPGAPAGEPLDSRAVGTGVLLVWREGFLVFPWYCGGTVMGEFPPDAIISKRMLDVWEGPNEYSLATNTELVYARRNGAVCCTRLYSGTTRTLGTIPAEQITPSSNLSVSFEELSIRGATALYRMGLRHCDQALLATDLAQDAEIISSAGRSALCRVRRADAQSWWLLIDRAGPEHVGVAGPNLTPQRRLLATSADVIDVLWSEDSVILVSPDAVAAFPR